MKKCYIFLFVIFFSLLQRDLVAQQNPGIPTYHKVVKGETIYSIAKKYKCTKGEIKKWNKLQTDALKLNQKLIVGYKPASAMPSENQTESKKVVEKKDEVASTAQASATKIAPPDSTKKQYKEIIEGGIATWIDDGSLNPNKYFALHNKASVGTLIKVTNTITKKVVYVQVIGKIHSTVKMNAIVVVTKAASQKLGVEDEAFVCKISYAKEVK